MEWTIPIQTYQTEHVQLGPMTLGPKPMIPLSYKDSDFYFPALTLLLPPLSIKSYDIASGRLVLSTTNPIYPLTKLQTLQEHLIHAVLANQSTWFPRLPSFRKPGEIRAGFQAMCTDQELHLYCPLLDAMPTGIPVYVDGAWKRCTGSVAAGHFNPGATVRIALRILGLSFHIHPVTGTWSGKFRLQHKVVAMYMMPAT